MTIIRRQYYSLKEGIIMGMSQMPKLIIYYQSLRELIRALVDNKIKFDDESKKFYETQCLAYKDVVTPFVKPYFHLSSSLFYHIKWNKGTKVESYAKLHQESSLRRSQNMHILMILFGNY